MEKNRLPYQIQEMLQDQDVYTPTDKRRNPASRAEFELQRKLLDLKWYFDQKRPKKYFFFSLDFKTMLTKD